MDASDWNIERDPILRLVIENIPFQGKLVLKKVNARFSSRVYVNGQELLIDGTPSSPQLGREDTMLKQHQRKNLSALLNDKIFLLIDYNIISFRCCNVFWGISLAL